MSLTVKAYLHKDWVNEPIETRRFALDQDVATNYTYLTEKLAKIFPQLCAQNIIISYLDCDGDRVTVSSDEELTDALDQFDGTIFRLHIKERNSESDGGNLPFIPPFFCPPRQFSGWPAGPFAGAGFCNPQNRTQKQEGDNEPKDETSPDQQQDTPQAKEDQKGPYHPDGVVCDGCSGSIYGRRYKCTTCPDYDLCGSCEGKGIHKEHSMSTIDRPRRCGRRQRQWPGGFGGPMDFNFGPFGGTFEMWGHPGNCGGNNTRPFWGPGRCTGFGNNTANDDKREEPASVPKPEYTQILEQLQAMGFEDEGGWLYELVKAKEGDLQKILDALHPATGETPQ